ncbi:MAG: YhcN/YlaJ family sporulation lipoprotein [Clostridiales bacterium]|jgi:hypothetical protein|nr:YhcN/YlaJ family sporulation lipoprotein [Clostridiales bacterium]
MKKYIVAFCLSLVFFFAYTRIDVPTLKIYCASALSVNELENVAIENPKVKKARAFIYGDVAVVAIKSQAIFFRSENVSLKNDIKRRVLDIGLRDVYVTTDTDIFFKIDEANRAYEQNKSNVEYSHAKASILQIVKSREY